VTRAASVLASTAVLAASHSPVGAQADLQRTALHDYRVVTVATGLVVPWSIARIRAVPESEGSGTVA